jgi:hypothetical protein
MSEGRMSTKFVLFTNAHTKKPILVNPAHVSTATEADSHTRVRLAMEGGEHAEEVEGDLQTVWAMLTAESERAPSHAPEPPPNAPMSIDLTLP